MNNKMMNEETNMVMGTVEKENGKVFKRYDVITFSEGDKVVVLASLIFEGNEYVYVQEVLPDESDVLENYKIMIVHEEDDTLQKETDPWILYNIAPKFQKILMDMYPEEEGGSENSYEAFEADNDASLLEQYRNITNHWLS